VSHGGLGRRGPAALALALALAGRLVLALARRVVRRRRSRGHCSGAGRRFPAVRLGAERARGRADVVSWWWAPGTSA
jgi:hypothetical protein